MEVTVSRDMLVSALASHLDTETGGMLNVEVGELRGVSETGESFPITGVILEASRKLAPLPAPVNHVTPTGHRLSLATFEGRNL